MGRLPGGRQMGLALVLVFTATSIMADSTYDAQGLRINAVGRTPEQMTAFYGARHFPKKALPVVAQACFITVGLRHHRDGVVWLEPHRWEFLDDQGRTLPRLDRDYWRARWQEIKLPSANRATFGWTLLPESRGLLTDEPVGGNVTLTPTTGPITVVMHFPTGTDKSGTALQVTLTGLRCTPTSAAAVEPLP